MSTRRSNSNKSRGLRTAAVVLLALFVGLSGVLGGLASASPGHAGVDGSRAAVIAQHVGKPELKLHLEARTVTAHTPVVASTKGTRVPAKVRSMVTTFGDGSSAIHSNHLMSDLRHSYNKPGDYTVSVRVTDREGRTSHRSERVRVVRASKSRGHHGLGGQIPQHTVQPVTTLPGATQLPNSVDLSGDAMTPGYQGDVGSCTTWAINYGLMGWYANHDHWSTDRFAPMYTYTQLDAGERLHGSYPQDVLSIAQTQGVDSASHYGSGWDSDFQTQPSSADVTNAANYKISGWRWLFENADASGASAADIYNIKAQLASGYPLAIGMKVYNSFDDYNGGQAYTDTSNVYTGAHSVLVVGYNASGVVIENSWGASWGADPSGQRAAAGQDGYMLMSWATVAKDVYEAEAIYGLAAPHSAGDQTAPTATAPVQRFVPGSTTASNGVPVAFSWSGSDNSGSVASYDLWARTNSGSWAEQTLPTSDATTITYDLAPGSTYQFAVRARDAAGNVGDWEYGPTFAVSDYQEDSSAVQYAGAGWTYSSSSSAEGGQLALSAEAGDSVSFTYTGRDLAWVATSASNQGQAYVYIDGQYKLTVDLGARSFTPRELVVTSNSSDDAQHTVKIVVAGTSGRPTVNLDSFVVLG